MRLPRILCTALTLTANDTKSEIWKKYQVLEIILSQKKNKIRPDLKLILYSFHKKNCSIFVPIFHNIKKIVVHRNNKLANNLSHNAFRSSVFTDRFSHVFLTNLRSLKREEKEKIGRMKNDRDRFRFARRLKGVS